MFFILLVKILFINAQPKYRYYLDLNILIFYM